jgi:small-conductance mechanosensitive channel
MKVKSELHQEIDRSFREAKIEIAFPQRDLRLRSVDESVIFQSTEAAR